MLNACFSVEDAKDVLEEIGRKLRPVVGGCFSRRTIVEYPVVDQDFCDIPYGESFHRNGFHEFRELVRDY